MNNLAVRITLNSTFQHKYAIECNLHNINSSKNVFYSLTCYYIKINEFTEKDKTYEILFTAVKCDELCSQIVEMRHYFNDSTLKIEYRKFLAINNY